MEKNSNLAEYQKRRAMGLVKPVNLSPMEKLHRKPTSRAFAVNAMCWQCQGEDADPCIRWRIGNCEIPECALYNLRPYRKLKGEPVPKALLGNG